MVGTTNITSPRTPSFTQPSPHPTHSICVSLTSHQAHSIKNVHSRGCVRSRALHLTPVPSHDGDTAAPDLPYHNPTPPAQTEARNNVQRATHTIRQALASIAAYRLTIGPKQRFHTLLFLTVWAASYIIGAYLIPLSPAGWYHLGNFLIGVVLTLGKARTKPTLSNKTKVTRPAKCRICGVRECLHPSSPPSHSLQP